MIAILVCVLAGFYLYTLRKSSEALIRVECENSKLVPQLATSGSACFDLCAHLPHKPLRIKPGETKKIPTGLAMHIPHGMEVVVRSRSGLTLKGIVVANSPGTIDSDYRKQIFILLRNVGKENFLVQNGMRVAQAGARCVPSVEWRVVSSIAASSRGGFGSTGLTTALQAS